MDKTENHSNELIFGMLPIFAAGNITNSALKYKYGTDFRNMHGNRPNWVSITSSRRDKQLSLRNFLIGHSISKLPETYCVHSDARVKAISLLEYGQISHAC